MDIGMIVLAVIVSGVILFVWNGLTQNLIPWGTKTLSSLKSSPGTGAALAQITRDGMIYIDDLDDVVAFVAIKPKAYYNIGRFFGIEFVTQLIAGLVLTLILSITINLPLEARLGLVALVGSATIASVDLPYWNWWGFSTLYTVGVAVNRITGYLIAGFVVASLILR